MVTRRENPEVKAVDKSELARFFHLYICKRRIFAVLRINNKLKGFDMIELKLTPHQASVVWAALLVAEDNALDNARGSCRQKALDTAGELRALRHWLTLQREALRE